jgi:hypothetical protein
LKTAIKATSRNRLTFIMFFVWMDDGNRFCGASS